MPEQPAKSSAGIAALERAAAAAKPGSVDLDPGHLLNMELSHLEFQDKVVDMAIEPGMPLLERIRFIAILGGNLDEFFMTRVAGFKRQLALGNDKTTLDGLTPQRQLDLIGERVRALLDRVYGKVLPELLSELEDHGIELVTADRLDEDDARYLRANYVPQLDAVVTPLQIPEDGGLPHIRNLRPALIVSLQSNEDDARRKVLVELPSDVPTLVPLPGGRRFVPLEEVLRMSLPRLLDGSTVLGAWVFRVTRSGNLMLDADNPDDLIDVVAETVARRPFQPVVRLEVEAGMPEEDRQLLLTQMRREAERRLSVLDDEAIYAVDGLIDLERLGEIASLPLPDLRFPKQRRSTPLKKEPSVFEQLRNRDILTRFPKHSFERTVERFLSEAASDPDVESICITLYRTARSSKVVRLLRRAHQNGKKVLAMIEVKASFDERRNIEWARTLEAAGIRVLYGTAFLKVHAKICSVCRSEGGKRTLYSYVGTGNLNAATAATYTDLGLLTADQKVGQELADLFATMAGDQLRDEFETLVVAPFNMRSRFIDLIEQEIAHARSGKGGRMTIKLNGLADREFIDALYRASQAGVRMNLLIRGICSLRPGVPGLSENIRVFSIVGRFLEHSRIYRFDNAGQPEYLIGSADWRGRNLSRRVEVCAPVPLPGHRRILDRILEADLHSPNAWELMPDGSYVRQCVEATP